MTLVRHPRLFNRLAKQHANANSTTSPRKDTTQVMSKAVWSWTAGLNNPLAYTSCTGPR